MPQTNEPVTIDATIVSETVDGVTRKMPSAERSAGSRSERSAGSGRSSVRDQQRSARDSRHPNVTSGSGGYRSSVSGGGSGGYRSSVSGGGGVRPGNVGKKVSWDSNGDGRVDLREMTAGVLRWFASVLASPNTYAFFFLATGSTAAWFNASAWISAAYRSNHPIPVALIMWVGITSVECYHVLSTMTPRSAVAKLVRAARKPDILPTLDSDYVKNAHALVDDLQKQMAVKSNLPWFITSIFFLALEAYIVADPETFMNTTGIDPLGCATTLFIVGGMYMSCVGYKFAIGQTLSRIEQALVDDINQSMGSTKTTKMS